MSIAIRQITTEIGVDADGKKLAAACFRCSAKYSCGDVVIWDNPPLLHSRR
jgi:alpha-ketoglutarate-dependent taurine dioxygenase